MKTKLGLFLFLALICTALQGQNDLSKVFHDFEIVSIDSKNETRRSQENSFETQFSVPSKNIDWNLDLTKVELVSKDFAVRTSSDVTLAKMPVATQGTIKGDASSKVSLTFNDGFVYGYVVKGGEYFYIEPLSHFVSTKKKDQYVFYSEKDIKDQSAETCASDMHKHDKHDHKSTIKKNNRRQATCYEIEYATANDYAMFEKYGSVEALINHNVAVINNVQSNYDDEFSDEVRFKLVETYVEDQPNNTWTATNNIDENLRKFSEWGATGFSQEFDVATLWSGKEFDGTAVGLAWVGSICSQKFKFNVVQDNNDAEVNRVVLAHELGHNFGAQHDEGTGHIMTTHVHGGLTTWSAVSLKTISDYLFSRECLSTCSGTKENPDAPVANFSYATSNICAESTLLFENKSTGENLVYAWEFEGGQPATSIDENPEVMYSEAGVYGVTLRVTNEEGKFVDERKELITVTAQPSAFFGSQPEGLNVRFTNFCENGMTYEWNFGDGSKSTQEEVEHEYAKGGTYIVSLKASNTCGWDKFENFVTVVGMPKASFYADKKVGCAPLKVNFLNQSTNASSYKWEIEGASPSTTTVKNPSVTFEEAGFYTVKLTVSNNAGEDVLVKEQFIEVMSSSVSNFDFNVDDAQVAFSNTSTDAKEYLWNFGDGNTSTEENPRHLFEKYGVYEVSLTAINKCGIHTYTQKINVGASSLTSLKPFNNIACVGTKINFEVEKGSVTSEVEWVFDGGYPVASSADSPVVEYSEVGTYDVLLITTDNGIADTSTYIVYVNDVSTPSFDFEASANAIVFSNTTIDADVFTWNFGDGTESNDINPTHVYASNGTYEVSLSVENTCGVKTITQIVDVEYVISSDEDLDYRPFSIYPSPTSDYVNVEYSGTYRLSLYNNMGELVLYKTYSSSERVDLQDYSSGLYVIQLLDVSSQKTFTQKLVVSK